MGGERSGGVVHFRGGCSNAVLEKVRVDKKRGEGTILSSNDIPPRYAMSCHAMFTMQSR